MFETFSGIGAQHKALQFIKDYYGYDYEIVATSEWDIDAIISYACIHYPNFKKEIKLPKESEIDSYLSNFVHSFSGKTPAPIKKLLSLPIEKK